MYLLVCTVEEGRLKQKVEEVMSRQKMVKLMTWLNGENGKSNYVDDEPVIVGSLRSLLRREEQSVLLAKIEGKDNMEKIIDRLKNAEELYEHLKYFVLPVVA